MQARFNPRRQPHAVVLLFNLLGGLAIAEETPPVDATPAADEVTFQAKDMHDGIRRLMEHFQSAAEREPNDAAHRAGLADACAMLWCFGFVPRDEVFPTMEEAAKQAVRLDADMAAARTAQGIVHLSQWDWLAAERELGLAIELEPERAASRQWYALYLAAMGRRDEALDQANIAVALDDSAGVKTSKGAVLYFNRDWPGLIDHMRDVTRSNPNFAPGYDWLGMAYCQELRFDESIEVYEKAAQLSGGLAEIMAGLGHAYGLAGNEQEARKVLRRLQITDERWYAPPVQIAFVHIGLKQYNEAFAQLDRAIREHSWELVFAGVEPWLDPIHDDPRFEQVLKKLDFPDGANLAR